MMWYRMVVERKDNEEGKTTCHDCLKRKIKILNI